MKRVEVGREGGKGGCRKGKGRWTEKEKNFKKERPEESKKESVKESELNNSGSVCQAKRVLIYILFFLPSLGPAPGPTPPCFLGGMATRKGWRLGLHIWIGLWMKVSRAVGSMLPSPVRDSTRARHCSRRGGSILLPVPSSTARIIKSRLNHGVLVSLRFAPSVPRQFSFAWGHPFRGKEMLQSSSLLPVKPPFPTVHSNNNLSRSRVGLF